MSELQRLNCFGNYDQFGGYYDADEADKVIAEKDESIDELEERIDELQKATDSAWSKVNAMYDELRHSNYKRCLAMAKVCYLRFVRYENYLQKLCASNATIAAYKFRRDLYDKWEKRWLEFAEKFKEAK